MMYIAGKSGGIVYSPSIKPNVSAMLMQVCADPHFFGNFYDIIRRHFARLSFHSIFSSLSYILMSGARILIVVVVPSWSL
jgi:hypothetical protein